MSRYTVYLSDSSYFSGKLEGALRAKRIGYARRRIRPAILLDEVLPNTGWMKVPAVRRDDGLWLADSTPLLRWLDAEHPQRALIPADPYRRFLSALVEDYCDEWHWRPAMFWRWAYPDNARWRGAQLGRELAENSLHPAWAMGTFFRLRQQRLFVRGDGVRRANFDAIAELYPQALGWLEALLASRPFLLGARPSLVDVAWFGPMFRHYAQDPRPAALMIERAPRVWAWVARLWNSADLEWDDSELDDFSDRAWDAVFADLGSAYLPYLRGNALALARGQGSFSGTYGGITYPDLPVVRYRARCLATLRRDYGALDPEMRARVHARLRGLGVIEGLEAEPVGDANPIDSPRCTPRALGWRERVRFYFTGTPWNPAGP